MKKKSQKSVRIADSDFGTNETPSAKKIPDGKALILYLQK